MTFLLVKWLKRLAKCSLSKVKLYKDILLFLFPITVWKLGNLNFLFLPRVIFSKITVSHRHFEQIETLKNSKQIMYWKKNLLAPGR